MSYPIVSYPVITSSLLSFPTMPSSPILSSLLFCSVHITQSSYRLKKIKIIKKTFIQQILNDRCQNNIREKKGNRKEKLYFFPILFLSAFTKVVYISHFLLSKYLNFSLSVYLSTYLSPSLSLSLSSFSLLPLSLSLSLFPISVSVSLSPSLPLSLFS